MAASLGRILSQIHRWVSPGLGELSDAVLLERFVQRRDEPAFAELAARYGGMVLHLCRRILGNVHDAEDALQATFLILARKAHTLRQPAELPAWLYGVARRVASKARAKAAVRAGQTSLADEVADCCSDPLVRLMARELLTVFDEEVNRLPMAQRSAVLLCCLEGRSQEEAARMLGCTPGSLRGHLQRGRHRLHDRLLHRGIALPAALAIVTVSHGETASAPLLRSTVTAAESGGAGSQAAWLAHSVLRTMLLGKLAVTITVVLTAALAASAIALSYRGPTTEPSDDKPTTAAAPSTAPEKPATEPRVDRFGDPLPEGAMLRLGTVRWRAGACIYAAALSPDDKLVAAACESGITFFDVQTGKPRHLRESLVPIRYDNDPIGSRLAFSPDGKQLVNVTRWGNLRFWDVATGKLLRVVGNGDEPLRGAMQGQPFPPPIMAPPAGYKFFTKVWFTRGKPSVIACNHDNYVAFIDPCSGKTDLRFRAAGPLASVAADGKTLAALDAKKPEVVLYDDQGKELRRFRHGNKIKLGTTLILGGKRLVTVNEKAEIKIWDVASGKELRTITGPTKNPDEWAPSAISISADGNTLFAGTQGGDILRLDLRDSKELSPLRGHLGGLVTGVFPTKDGRSLVSVSWDQLVLRWDLTTGKLATPGEGYASRVLVARSPDGRSIATASHPDRLEFWDAKTGKRLRAFSLGAGGFQYLRFSPDGKRLALASSDAKVRLWDVESERVGREWKMTPARQPANGRQTHFFEGLAWSPDGRFLLTSLGYDGLRLWEAASGKEIWRQERHGEVAFSADGKTIASGGWDNCLSFWDAATGKRRFDRKEKQGDAIRSIAFSPDGRSLAISNAGSLSLRDPNTGEVKKDLPNKDLIWSLSFSPDSKWLASGSYDGTVRIWEVATGAEVLRRKGHEGWVLQVEFGPDGRTVLSSSLDLTSLLWHLRPNIDPSRKRNFEALWTDLAAEPAKAYRAIWELVGDPQSASAVLRKKLSPVKIDVDEKRLRALLADLDSDDFDKRESASRALAAMGAAIEIPLRRALADTPSAEVQRRLRGLLDALKREPTPEDHRLMRAVQVMELCSTIEARKVLREWAGGAAGAPLTEQAKEALKRLRLADKAEPRP